MTCDHFKDIVDSCKSSSNVTFILMETGQGGELARDEFRRRKNQISFFSFSKVRISPFIGVFLNFFFIFVYPINKKKYF
jgi:hypothetical protein